MYRYLWLSLLSICMPSRAELALHDFLSCRGWNHVGRFAEQRPPAAVLQTALQAMREQHSAQSQQIYFRPTQPLYIYGNAPVNRVVLATQAQPAVSTVLLDVDLPASQLKTRIEHALQLTLPYDPQTQLYQITHVLTSLTARQVRVLTLKAKGDRSILYCGERLDPLTQPITQMVIENNQLILH